MRHPKTSTNKNENIFCSHSFRIELGLKPSGRRVTRFDETMENDLEVLEEEEDQGR